MKIFNVKYKYMKMLTVFRGFCLILNFSDGISHWGTYNLIKKG